MIKPNAQMSVKELLECCPGAMRFFVERRMMCVGCPTEAFHTIEEVARIHHLSPEALLDSLDAALSAEAAPSKNQA